MQKYDVTGLNYLYPVLVAIMADCIQSIFEAFAVQNLLLFLFPEDHKWISRNSKEFGKNRTLRF
ncbi:MAG: hypothetical protein ABS69_08405 [Nitrosomonadales bacterium SCN 54-20]|nr:MAG: hypothetical protein ABS69_08405 [Nitrosomonadales bacterium SCN 54-20]